MCLSEVTMYASWLLEDEDSRVEMAVRAMIKTMKAVTATMSCVADAAPGTAEELLPLGTKDLSTALVACRQFGLQTGQKEHTWWWHDVACSCLGLLSAACKPSEGAGSEAKPFADALEELRDPVANLLDIFEFLSQGQDSSATTSLRSALEAAGHARESGVKLQMQVREVRLKAVKCVHRIWMDLGVQVVMCLSEVTMYASWLLEDEDSRVEMAVRAMIKTIKDCTGESLQDTLKS